MDVLVLVLLLGGCGAGRVGWRGPLEYVAICNRWMLDDGIFCPFFESSAVFTLHGLDLNLLLGDFFAEELNTLRLLLIAAGLTDRRTTDSVLADL